MKANTITYQPEPNNEICLGVDVMSACDVPHGVRSVARVHKKRWCSGYWMILRYMDM